MPPKKSGLLGGLTPNDTVSPAWSAVNGDDNPHVPLTEDGLNEFAADTDGTETPQAEGSSAFAGYLAEQIDIIDLDAVPDADDIAPNSPVDPAAPPTDVVNGTDLLNGAGAEDIEE
jgi:hypothetical protein